MPPVEPLCLECHKLMYPLRNGVMVSFGKSTDAYASFISADIWCCNTCGKKIVKGWAGGYHEPLLLENFLKDRKEWIVFVEDGVEINALSSKGSKIRE